MNERILELARQANKDLEGAIPLGFAEKFAELIVAECADIAKHHVMNISTYADADFVDEQIKKHFGVKE
jgi:hypothetical protein